MVRDLSRSRMIKKRQTGDSGFWLVWLTSIRNVCFALHSPVVVDAPEAGQDVSEAGVAVQLGLTLRPFDGALQPSTQEALGGEI